jgi:hypothetical protein
MKGGVLGLRFGVLGLGFRYQEKNSYGRSPAVGQASVPAVLIPPFDKGGLGGIFFLPKLHLGTSFSAQAPLGHRADHICQISKKRSLRSSQAPSNPGNSEPAVIPI